MTSSLPLIRSDLSSSNLANVKMNFVVVSRAMMPRRLRSTKR